MIWVAWRQFRTQAFVTLGLLAAFAGLVLVTGLHLRDVYDSLGGAHCAAGNDCTALGGHDKPLADLLGPALLAIPPLLGMFWGAPLLARELETGTYRLAWTQSVTRRRWLSVRVALVGVAALAVAGIASWLVSWWFAPLDAVNLNRFDPSVFDTRGVVAIGYAGFAFALGVAAGALTRRTLPAMGATLVGFIAARIAVTLWVRPHLLASRHVLFPLELGKDRGFFGFPTDFGVFAGLLPSPNAWALSSALVNRAHHALSAAQIHELFVRTCPTFGANYLHNPGAGAGKGAGSLTGGAFFPCLHALSLHLQLQVAYQPPGHYWPLQALETGIFLAAALALIGATVWRIGRRRAGPPAVGEPHERSADPLALELAPEIAVPPARPDRKEPTIMQCRRPPMLTAVLAVAALSLLAAGCGSSSSSSSNAFGSSGQPTQAQLQQDGVRFADCMRSHGVSSFPDPGSHGFKAAFATQAPAFWSTERICGRLVPGFGPSGPRQSAPQSQAQIAAMLAFARCIRSHGFSSFPDPTTSGQLTHEMLAGAGINLHQPAVLQAGDACTSVTHGVITKAAVARFVAGQ